MPKEKEIREFLKTVNEVDKTTVILTTHDMKDIEQLCKRVMMIDKGNLIYDGDLEQLKENYLKEKTIRFKIDKVLNLERFEELKAKADHVSVEEDREHWQLSLDKVVLGDFVSELLQIALFRDFNITEPELEDVVGHIYEHGIGGES